MKLRLLSQRFYTLALAILSGLCLLSFSTCTSGSAEKGKTSPLNVLFIAVDDLRPQLACYGDSTAITPTIDALARNGMVFNRAYCQQAVCNPSRASIMTGQRPNTTKVWDLKTHFREALPEVITLPQYFKQHGYHTQSVGKIYHDPGWAQDSLSWSAPETMAVTETSGKYVKEANLHKKGSWKATATERTLVPDSAYIDGKVGNAAVRILNEIQDKPFFLAIGFRRPHLPFSAPEKYWGMYDRETLPLPANPQAPANVPEVAMHNWTELRGYTDIPDSGPLQKEKIRELIHGYYASTSYIDAQIGKVLDELKRLDLMENTIVVLWSDHGFHLGEQDLWGKTTNFELDTRVPLIVSSPEQLNKGQHSNALVELVDVYPTLVDLAGFTVPGDLAGTSLKPLLNDPELSWNEVAYSQFPRPMGNNKPHQLMGYSVRTNNFRYTEWENLQTGAVEARELYDHRTDPLENNNIAESDKYSAEIKKLEKVLRKGFK